MSAPDTEDEAPTLNLSRNNEYSVIFHDGEYVAIHRLVAVAEYGYDAVADHDVHHRDGHRMNNSPENLELVDNKDHAMQHNEQRHGIEDTSYREEGTLVWLYENLDMTIEQVADRFAVSSYTIHKWLHEHNLIETESDQSATMTQPNTVDEDPQHSLFDFATNEVAVD